MVETTSDSGHQSGLIVKMLPGVVDVWLIPFKPWGPDCALRLAGLRDSLSFEEQTRADGLRGEQHRWDSIQAHAALRRVLGTYLEVEPTEVQFADGSNADTGKLWGGAGRTKPQLKRGPAPAVPGHPSDGRAGSELDLRFNLSHTRGAALIGVGLGLELGIDIEWQRPMDDLDAMARSVMSDRELERWMGLPAGDRQPAFYRLWTRKEAYLKAIGLGLYRSLQDVTVPVSASMLDDATGRAYRVEDRAGQGVWTVRDIPVPEGYSASICCEGARPARIEVRELDLAGSDGPCIPE